MACTGRCPAPTGSRRSMMRLTSAWRWCSSSAESQRYILICRSSFDMHSTCTRHALDRAVRVEVYSNLVYVPETLWKVFSQPGVRLATSYYSNEAQQHEQITQRRGSYARTRTNIREALRRSIPLRVGVIEVRDSQRIERACAELAALGVTDVHVDRLRRVGRGANQEPSDVNELCGHCAQGVVAVSPTGEVWPCVFARWMPLGNVRTTPYDGDSFRHADGVCPDGVVEF